MFNMGFPPDWSTLRKLIWLRAALLRAASAVIRLVTGSAPLILPNAVSHAIHSLTQYGLCTQASTPTPDAPVDIMCNNGALRMLNLANVAESNLDIGDYLNNSGVRTASTPNFYTLGFVPVKPNTAYTMKTSASLNYFNVMEYDSAQGFLNRTLWGAAGSPAGDTVTFTTRSDTAYIRFGSNMNGNTLTYADISAVTWMLTEGATAQDYVPYGQLSVVGTPEVLTINGITLIAEADIVANKGLNSTVGEPFANSNRCYTGFGYFPAGTNFIIRSKANSMGGYLFQYSANDAAAANFISAFRMGDAVEVDGWYERRATTTQDAWLFAQYGAKKTTAISDEWSALMPRATAPVVDLFAVGDYADAAEIIEGIKTGKVGVHVFDGTETFGKSSAYGAAFYIQSASSAWGAKRETVMCSHYLGMAPATGQREVNTCFFNASGHFYIRVADNSDTAAFKADLAEKYASGNPVILLYALSTEQTEQTAAHSLHTTEGTVVVDVVSNVDPVVLECEYYGTPAAGFGLGSPSGSEGEPDEDPEEG